MPKQLSSSGALTLRRLFFYSAKKDREAQNKLVYFLKHHKNKRAAHFAATQLIRAAKDELDTLEVPYSEAVVVNMPRGRRAVKTYGFDQSKEVSEELAKMLGATFADVIKRRVGGKEQKKLNAAERRRNIKKLMSINAEDAKEVKGKYVLLFDDGGLII
jgi:predicted amidophosphoribosyltransferase